MVQKALKMTRKLGVQWPYSAVEGVAALKVPPRRRLGTWGPTITGLSSRQGAAEQYRGGPVFHVRCSDSQCSSSVCGAVVEGLGSGLFGFFFLFFFLFHRADEFAGVWAVASVALRGPAIYQAEAESAGSPKGKKHGLLYRLTPLLPSYSLSLFYPRPSVALRSQSEDMLFRAVFVRRE